jgi:hypothetical protein
VIEGHVIDHLEAFVGDAEQWLIAQARDRDASRQQLVQAAQSLRIERSQIDQRRERLLDEYERLLADDDASARLVLDRAARLDAERDDLTARIADAEAVAAEWADDDGSGLADAVDLLKALRDADTAQALGAALSRALAGIYASVRGHRLHAEFELAAADGVPYLLRHANPVGLDAGRLTLPGASAIPGASPSCRSSRSADRFPRRRARAL